MKPFFAFVREFFQIFWVARGILLVMIALIVVCGFLYSLVEALNIGDSIYMSFITALTIGYGDFVPLTTLGKCISILVGFIGMIFIGLSVAIATVALKNILEKNPS